MSQEQPFDPVPVVCGMRAHRRPFVALASDETGWFGGASIVASDPTKLFVDVSRRLAGDVLESVFLGSEFRLAVALIPYRGFATVHVYSSAMVRENGVWAPRGTGHMLDGRPVELPSGPLMRQAIAELDAPAFAERVRAIQGSIADGDVYVLNLTYRLRGVPSGPPGGVFAQLTSRAPAPMQALFSTPTLSVASVSPERFLAIDRMPDGSRVARIQPIKGTAPRGEGARDLALAEELRASAKERAEHVMIVDLERNDLGRVCVPGTVAAEPLFDVIATPYCHQMVSTVQGTLRTDSTIADVIEATFPCGSVTGAPKEAAMRRIAELEPSSRGAYTGALLVAMPGRLDSSVLIRTLEWSGGAALWGTGCGITIESDASAEWEESVLKTWPILVE